MTHPTLQASTQGVQKMIDIRYLKELCGNATDYLIKEYNITEENCSKKDTPTSSPENHNYIFCGKDGKSRIFERINDLVFVISEDQGNVYNVCAYPIKERLPEPISRYTRRFEGPIKIQALSIATKYVLGLEKILAVQHDIPS